MSCELTPWLKCNSMLSTRPAGCLSLRAVSTRSAGAGDEEATGSLIAVHHVLQRRHHLGATESSIARRGSSCCRKPIGSARARFSVVSSSEGDQATAACRDDFCTSGLADLSRSLECDDPRVIQRFVDARRHVSVDMPVHLAKSSIMAAVVRR